MAGANRARNPRSNWHQAHREDLSSGQRLADSTARTLGSWPFIIGQTVFVLAWITLNAVAWSNRWDPYPFILLNLMFSVQAAYAAPIIMMSQNRQAERDRYQAQADYDTNVLAEHEIEDIQAHLDRIEAALGRLTAGAAGAEAAPGVPAASDAIVRNSLTAHYHGALAMLGSAVTACPDELWAAQGPGGSAPFWRVAYHTLYYTHLYLMPDERSFTPWEHHQTGLQDLDDEPTPEHLLQYLELPHRPPQTGKPLSKDEVLAYLDHCDRMVEPAVASLDLSAEETGFSWHTPTRPRFSQQLSNLRHIQHHTAHLASRLREATGSGIEWVSGLPGPSGVSRGSRD